jgi:hypothetical protein
VLNAEEPEWRKIEVEAGPSARSGHSLVYDDDTGRLFLFGGMSFQASGELKIYRDLWVFSGDEGWKREFFSAGPSGRAWHAAQAAEGSMLVFGGYSGPPQYYLQDVWSLDMRDLSFRRIATDGGPLMAGSAVLLGMGVSSSLLAFGPSKLLVFGRDGVSAPAPTGLWSLQVELDRWSFIETRNPPDDDFSCGFADPEGKTILVGRGPEEDDGEREWTFWAIAGADDRWREYEVSNGPATSHAMACVPNPGRDGGWICFGGARNERVGGETWMLSTSREAETTQ